MGGGGGEGSCPRGNKTARLQEVPVAPLHFFVTRELWQAAEQVGQVLPVQPQRMRGRAVAPSIDRRGQLRRLCWRRLWLSLFRGPVIVQQQLQGTRSTQHV